MDVFVVIAGFMFIMIGGTLLKLGWAVASKPVNIRLAPPSVWKFLFSLFCIGFVSLGLFLLSLQVGLVDWITTKRMEGP